MLKLATHILDTKKGHFEPDKFEDRYENALIALIKAKRAGKAPPTMAEPRPSNVINLMDALRRSARADRSQPAASRKSGHHRKRPAARRKVRRASSTSRLNGGAENLPGQAQVRRHCRTEGKYHAQDGPCFRHPEACGAADALRPTA